MLYPNGRTGPLGEIGVWAILQVVAGDGSGGNSVTAASFRNATNKLGVSIAFFGMDYSSTTLQIAQVVFAHRMPGNESLFWVISSLSVGGPSTSGILPSESQFNPRTVYYPVSLVPPFTAQPNFSITTDNVNGVTNTLRAFGYLWPHMMLQQQLTRVPAVQIQAT